MKLRFVSLFLLVACFQAFVVFAHGDEPRLEISVDRVNPGGVVDVRGVDFEREETVTLMLVNATTALPVGEITADVEGIFVQTMVLPVDLAEGTYNVLAITDDHNVTSPDLTVQGPAVLAEGEGEDERWEEEDQLPFPIPTYPPGVVPGAVPGVTPIPATESESIGLFIPPFAIALVALVLGAFLFVIRRRMG